MKTNTILNATVATIFIMATAVTPMTSFAGASVYRDNYDSGLICSDTALLDGNRICFQQKGTWNMVTTPSGNVNYTMKGTVFNSVGYAGYTSQTTVESNEKMLFKAGVPHNGHSFTTTSIVNSANGSCSSYTIEYDYSFANGNVTQNNYIFTSSPC